MATEGVGCHAEGLTTELEGHGHRGQLGQCSGLLEPFEEGQGKCGAARQVEGRRHPRPAPLESEPDANVRLMGQTRATDRDSSVAYSGTVEPDGSESGRWNGSSGSRTWGLLR